MTSSEELIEEAFKAHEDAPTWVEDSVGRDAAIRWHMRGFNDALAVFEKAHTPTDDEREALDDQRDAIKHALRNVKWTETGDLLGYIPEGVLGMYADAILAAGFRRTVQGEPTDAQVYDAETAFWVHKERTGVFKGAMRAALRAAGGVE